MNFVHPSGTPQEYNGIIRFFRLLGGPRVKAISVPMCLPPFIRSCTLSWITLPPDPFFPSNPRALGRGVAMDARGCYIDGTVISWTSARSLGFLRRHAGMNSSEVEATVFFPAFSSLSLSPPGLHSPRACASHRSKTTLFPSVSLSCKATGIGSLGRRLDLTSLMVKLSKS